MVDHPGCLHPSHSFPGHCYVCSLPTREGAASALEYVVWSVLGARSASMVRNREGGCLACEYQRDAPGSNTGVVSSCGFHTFLIQFSTPSAYSLGVNRPTEPRRWCRNQPRRIPADGHICLLSRIERGHATLVQGNSLHVHHVLRDSNEGAIQSATSYDMLYADKSKIPARHSKTPRSKYIQIQIQRSIPPVLHCHADTYPNSIIPGRRPRPLYEKRRIKAARHTWLRPPRANACRIRRLLLLASGRIACSPALVVLVLLVVVMELPYRRRRGLDNGHGRARVQQRSQNIAVVSSGATEALAAPDARRALPWRSSGA